MRPIATRNPHTRCAALPLGICLVAPMALAADLPDWFEQNRVQAHCELYRLQDDSAGLYLHKPIHDAGARAVTLIVDNLDEGAWWPSAVGQTADLARSRDIAREIIESVHGNDMKCIGYFRYMSDAWAQKEHPDWQCRNANGELVREPRGKRAQRQISVLCVNSPYRDFVQTRLCELAERGVDMIYFDSWHMPEVCACDFCRRKFEAVTGEKFPLATEAKGKAANEDEVADADGKITLARSYSNDYLRVSRFVSQSLIEAFIQWRAAVTKVDPNIRLVIGSSLYPMFLSQPQLSAEFVAIADSSKTEFKKEFGGNAAILKRVSLPGFAPPAFDIQTALGWSLVRDATGGRPPLMWVPHLTSEEDALRASAAAYSHGCVASMAFTDTTACVERFKSSFENGAKVSSALAHTRPYGWLAIHISERARNRRLHEMPLAWKEVIAPALGAFEAAVREHLPVVTINDVQLAAGIPAETRVLALASPDELDDAQRTAVDRWTQSGGKVIRVKPGEDWFTADGKAARMKALASQIRELTGKPPIRVTGPARMHAVFYRHPEGERLVVMLVNAWDDYESAARSPKSAACADVSIEIDPAFFPVSRATEALTGADLPLHKDRAVTVQIPEFQINRCVVLGKGESGHAR